MAAVLPPPADFVPGAERLLSDIAHRRPGMVLWPRHPYAPCGTSASRRALLPQAVFAELQRTVETTGEVLVMPPGANGAAHTVLYAPELVWRNGQAETAHCRVSISPPTIAGPCGSEFFAEVFTRQRGPWDYTSPYEQAKHQQTLDLLPRGRIEQALELACAEGHFTAQLAPRVQRLVAADVAAVALERARLRCQHHRNVEFQQLDLVCDPLPAARFDLIVCSEVLYYTGSLALLSVVADKLVSALTPGGYLVCAHAHLRVDDREQPGFDWELPFGAKTIGGVLGGTRGLRLVRELRTPLYRVQLFQRSPEWRRWLRWRTPQVTAIPLAAPLPDRVAAHVRWAPAPPEPLDLPPVTTPRLPILMYHRIATDGPSGLARYRVDPGQFEAQLQFLQKAGYQSATLEEWRAASEVKRPLRGRRVLITFDDGCVDFATTAWPLLGRYGFTALVFLPTDEVGGCCRWDARFGEPARLMDWADVRALHRDGVRFGSHTAMHPILTGLPLDEITREALRSRTAIEEHLGSPVTSVAYPYGATDPTVQALFGACGYRYGLTCADRCCEFGDNLLALPRIEVSSVREPAQFADLLAI